MTTHHSGIVGNGVTPPPLLSHTNSAGPTGPNPWPNAHLLRHPNDPIVQQVFEFKELSLKVREFLSYLVGTKTRDEAARSFWVQGRPGDGKTVGCLVACLNAGVSVAAISPGMLAGETEAASVEKLHAILDEMRRWSIVHKQRVVVQSDDFDLSIAAAAGDENVGHTVNAGLLCNELMALADNRDRYRNFDGSNIGFIFTVNDATGMRESLHRVGRAVWHDHVPTWEDKANIAWAVLAPKTSAERDLVDALVRKYANRQPVAFWKALQHKMRSLHDHPLIADGMPNQAAIDAAYGRRLPLIPDIAWQAARELRRAKVRSWLDTNKSRWGF